jgi:hypothetical protein
MSQKSSPKSKKTAVRSLRLIQDSGNPSKPKVIRRAGKRKSESENSIMEDVSMEREEVGHTEASTGNGLTVPTPETAKESETLGAAPEVPNSTPSAHALPPIAGFNLSGMSLNQQYAIRNAVVLCDCCVHKTPERIFDVLGRNFADTGALVWWLRRIGKGHLAEPLKGKDVVDAVRKTAHAPSLELGGQIGKPAARW